MADSPASASKAESPAQEKARLRRERRAAKIQGSGTSRLQAITSLQGGSHRDVEPVSKPTRTVSPDPAATPPARTETPDPDEIDISQHHYTPATQPRLPPSQPNPFAFNGTSTPPFPHSASRADPSQDPMMMMLQQMIGGSGGGMPGGPGGPGGPGDPNRQMPGDLPPGLANLFRAMQGGEPEPSPDQSSAWIWRIIHSLFSLALAFYIVFQTPFTGSRWPRTNHGNMKDWATDENSKEAMKHFFYMFATFEVVLQSSRYFVERGQLPGSGVLSSIAQMLPEPYAGYVRVVGRYSVIWRTVVSDAMVVVFVLGAASWWRDGITS
ncbi:hypothetical protein K469DRAFT_163892 [Zopfia rhizophila CBS 207.26]|uniref:GET complex, subunit GET2 n=1 Tax=Zopfia rhizophila CBS 207.26 TaxID=1314779 RepID=A0A6A6E3J4_9PEZI|nr:hypothetical protein K469DRAFT_163892 [Zopfia rhizophila CBS 207.26]